MAGKKISELTSGSLSNLNLDGILPIVYSGITLQYNLNQLRNKLVDSGSHVFTGSQVIVGDLTISGSIIAQQYVVSSSITNVVIQNVSGSSVFGNSLDDNHQFTGSVNITGGVKLQDELSVNGSVTASYFVGDGSQLTNLPIPTIDTSSLATTGSNIFVGNQTITGSLSFGDGSVIQSISSSSADDNGYSTLTLKPDVSLGTDQYIVLDPTAPNHIHIRPGGTVDNSGAELYIGGEKNYLRINDGAPSVRMQTESSMFINSYYFTSGSGVSSIEWTSDQFGNNFVKFNDPTIDVYNAIWAFNNPSTFTATYNGGNDYISFTVNGSSTPGLPQAASFYVLQAPPSSPTYLDYADIQILQNRQTYIEANGSDVRIQAADDVRIFSQDAFRLINYSATQPIEIITNYDNLDKTFAFNVDGTLTFPDGTTQNSAFTTSSFNEFATTGSNTFTGDETISGSLNISGSATLNNSNVVSSDTILKMETITSASYASITPVSGTLYIIID